MALRLIEMVLTEKDCKEARTLLEELTVLEHLQLRLADGEVLMRVLLDAEQSEAVLDVLEKQYGGEEGWRVVVLPVEATVPRADPDAITTPDQAQAEEAPPQRISREELYEDIKDAARCTRVYMAMVTLSTIVAAVGLYYNSVAIIIGAMVIAPLLGPNEIEEKKSNPFLNFLTRTRGPFWSIRPARILWAAVFGTQLVATLIAVYGLFMTPLGWGWALFVWGYALAWFLVNDRLKLLAYRLFDRASG